MKEYDYTYFVNPAEGLVAAFEDAPEKTGGVFRLSNGCSFHISRAYGNFTPFPPAVDDGEERGGVKV